MSEKGIRHIICAVRGRPESRETVTRAIDLALEHHAGLTFLHIMDAEFVEHATVGPLSVIYQELKNMGEFTLMILKDRAKRRGVQEVDYIIREGNIIRHIREFALETHAEMMVVGKPKDWPGRNIFRAHEFEDFMNQLEQDANITIVRVDPDK
jgi:nucleotide-binding universal stress UspA family protein